MFKIQIGEAIRIFTDENFAGGSVGSQPGGSIGGIPQYCDITYTFAGSDGSHISRSRVHSSPHLNPWTAGIRVSRCFEQRMSRFYGFPRVVRPAITGTYKPTTSSPISLSMRASVSTSTEVLVW